MIHSKVLKAAVAVFLLLLVAGICCGAAAAGSVASVSAENLTEKQPTNVLEAMASSTPGVQITQSSSQPGKGFKVYIRGIGTIGDAAPLYVIDGVAGGNLNGINPNDIETFTVLKDASATALYGSRGANGVLMKTPSSNISTSLEGKVAGVQITSDGQPGADPTVRIRGIGSFGSTAPLYVIDGVPMGTSIRDFSPNDLKTIQVLEDAAAGAIYGSRAANGTYYEPQQNYGQSYYGQSNFLTSVLNEIQKAIFGLLTNIFDTFLFL